MAPGAGLEDMAEKGPPAAGGSATTPARRQLGPFPGSSTLLHLASLPKPEPTSGLSQGEGRGVPDHHPEVSSLSELVTGHRAHSLDEGP